MIEDPFMLAARDDGMTKSLRDIGRPLQRRNSDGMTMYLLIFRGVATRKEGKSSSPIAIYTHELQMLNRKTIIAFVSSR